MPELRIEIDASLYARLSQMAEKQGKTPGEIVEEHIVQWLNPQPVTKDKGMWKAYVSLRMKGLEPGDIVEQLDCTVEDLSRWDQEIRSNPGRWNEAYFLMRKATDPLTWEMKVRDRFVAYWGEKPD
jgi:hypothetical protein